MTQPHVIEPHVTQRDLDAERTAVQVRVDALTRQFGALLESTAWGTTDDEHDPEGVTIAFERAQVQGLLSQARDELVALEHAGERLRNGTYGVCERCSAPIGALRLDALPAVRTCIRCAGRRRS